MRLKALQEAAARDVEELRPHLQLRGEELAEGARILLAKRADAESRDMREILEGQRKRLLETSRKYAEEEAQLTFGFDADERRQLDANRRHWRKRLGDIDRELESEPGRIRAGYEVKAWRVEPIGLVYLWPVSG